MIHESRRAPRRQVASRVPVLDTMSDEVIGHLGNLSESGMLLLANTPLLDDALYQFRFQPGLRSGTAITVGVHLLWSGPANTPGQAWCGFRFLNISDEQREHIREWVNEGEEGSIR
jgi:hypothetical protein